MRNFVKSILIVGGGSSGWMTAAYLSKAYGHKVKISLIEEPSIPKIGVGEATIPNLQRVFFDFLGLKEQDWMPHCNASFKSAIKFVGWNTESDSSDYFYHMFGQLKEVNGIPLSHYWAHLKNTGQTTEQFAYACYNKAKLLDAKLSPKDRDGRSRMSHAWHFDAHLVADYLRGLSVSWGVEHIQGEVVEARLNESGGIKSVRTQSGAEIAADFFVDCSGFKGLLINQALDEPFIDMSRYLLCDSAVAASITHDDEANGVEPYTSAIAMSSGWTWKIPLLGRFGSGYVYSSSFCSKETATEDFMKLWGVREDQVKLNHIKFRTGRNRRAWVKNCVSIGLSSCFLEPLESTGLYFIYAAIYQFAQHFPDATLDSRLADSFNKKIEMMFDDCRDFIQTHYFTTTRNDSDFWRANKHDLKISDSLREKLNAYNAGLVVCPPVTANESDYYGNFDLEFSNFWTNSNYYCMFAGLNWVPEKSNPKLIYHDEWMKQALAEFRSLKLEEEALSAILPTTYDYLLNIRGTRSA